MKQVNDQRKQDSFSAQIKTRDSINFNACFLTSIYTIILSTHN